MEGYVKFCFQFCIGGYDCVAIILNTYAVYTIVYTTHLACGHWGELQLHLDIVQCLVGWKVIIICIFMYKKKLELINETKEKTYNAFFLVK